MNRPLLSRRAVLRGALGATVALPLLEAMLPARAAAATPPHRYLVSFGGFSLGPDAGPPLTSHWVPSVVGAGYNLPTALQPLAAVRSHVSVISNLKIPTARDNNGQVPPNGKPNNFHGYMLSPLLSGTASAVGNTWCRGPTSDALMAAALGGSSPSPLVACVQPSPYVQGDSFQLISFSGDQAPNQPQTSPRALFQSLFGSFVPPTGGAAQNRELATRRLVVDQVKQSAERLQQRLGGADRRRLDQHLTELRALEGRLNAIPPVAVGACMRPLDPGPDPVVGGSNPVVNGSATYSPGLGYSDEELRATVMGELIYMAMVCDLRRSYCWQLTHPQSFLNVKALCGWAGDLHAMAHNGSDLSQAQMVGWHLKHWGRLVERLASAPEAGGTVLDRSALAFVCEGGRGLSEESGTLNSTHSSDNMMALLAGHAGGLKGGLHLQSQKAHPAEVLLTGMRACGYAGNLGRISAEVPGLR